MINFSFYVTWLYANMFGESINKLNWIVFISDNVEIALWLIVGILLLLLVIIIIVVIFYCRSKANGQNRRGFISTPTDEESPPNVCSNGEY